MHMVSEPDCSSCLVMLPPAGGPSVVVGLDYDPGFGAHALETNIFVQSVDGGTSPPGRKTPTLAVVRTRLHAVSPLYGTGTGTLLHRRRQQRACYVQQHTRALCF